MPGIIVLGAQWGDEGKGKIVDFLSSHVDIVARYQGGHNAGHTVYAGNRKIILKLIPAGILRPGVLAVIGNGLVVDPLALMEEMKALEAAGVTVEGQLFISNRAHVILPFHRVSERLSEARPDRIAIGTTSRGIGPCYEDKIGRRGIRIADLLDREHFPALFANLAEDRITLLRAFGIEEEFDRSAILAQYQEVAERIRPMVCDTARMLNQALADGKRVLFEGAQGTMLDIDHGTYPFVTSSSSAAGGACTGSGVSPTQIQAVFGVSKAYITRVGGGPFPTEDKGEGGNRLRDIGKEYGAVTGRPRRCGWFDVPLLRYTAMVNGMDSLILTKLDVLDSFSEIPVCVAYKLDGKLVEEFPATYRDLERLEPVYELLPGWGTPTHEATSFASLPAKAQAYLRYLEEKSGIEIGCISTGPERNQTFVVKGSKMACLFD